MTINRYVTDTQALVKFMMGKKVITNDPEIIASTFVTVLT